MAQTITDSDLGQDSTQQAGGSNNNNQPGAGPNSSQQQSAGGGSQAPTGSPQGQSSSGGSQAPTIGSGPAGSGPANPNQQKGSGYTNIQKIITANQGNQLGQAVGSGVQKAGQGLQSNLNTAQNQFNTDTANNQTGTAANQQLVNNVLAAPDQYGNLGQNNANSQAGGQFQQLISGSYQGPTQLANATQLQGQAQDVGQLNNALSNQAGQAGLLQRFVGNPQYTQGQQNLDQLLLGQTGGKDLAAARVATAGLGSKVNNALLGAQATGQQGVNQAQAYGQQVQNQFGNTVSGIDTGLQAQATQDQATRDAAYKNTLAALQSGNLTQQQASLFGLTNGQQVTGDALKNIGSYLTENPLAASAQNVASAQDYAKLDALRNLAGTNAPTSAQTILGQYANQDANAGAFNAAPDYTADQSGFNTVNAAQLANYHQNVDPLQQAQQAAAANLAKWNATGQNSGFGEIMRQQNLAGAQTQYNMANSAYQNALNSANAGTGGLQSINVAQDPNVQAAQLAALQGMQQNGGNPINTQQTALNDTTGVS